MSKKWNQYRLGFSTLSSSSPQGTSEFPVCSSLFCVLKGSQSTSRVPLIFSESRVSCVSYGAAPWYFLFKTILWKWICKLFIVEGISQQVEMGNASESHPKQWGLHCRSLWKCHSLSPMSVVSSILCRHLLRHILRTPWQVPIPPSSVGVLRVSSPSKIKFWQVAKNLLSLKPRLNT